MSTKLSQAPPLWRPKPEVPKTPKALIVGASYTFLTCKIDPNVEFWTPNRAKQDPTIPAEFTILWVADDLDANDRIKLLDQAIKRNMEIWRESETHKALSIRAVCIKLYGLWGKHSNQSLVEVIAENETTIRDGSPTRIEELKAAAERYRKGLSVKFDKPEPLKARGRPRLAREPEPPNAEIQTTPASVPKEALERLADSDRRVYEAFVRHAGKNGDGVAAVAAEMKYKKPNVQRILDRVRSKLELCKVG
ncbi:MAG: hypothetical protein WDN47_00045 [Candidatus Doudnabacteria bacterium]